jgi:hypothetical protein
MAHPDHLEQLNKGTAAWNSWRKAHPDLRLDLSGAHLEERDLGEVNLSETNLRGTQLSNARLVKATIRDADLSEAQLKGADLTEAALNRSTLIETNLHSATLKGAILDDANVRGANLHQVNLRGASLRYTLLADANLSGADLTGCAIYGVSVWNTRLDGAIQKNLVMTRPSDPARSPQEFALTVDRMEAAQFLYLLAQNAYTPTLHFSLMRHIVVIIGQFTPERKETFKTILRDVGKQTYVPVFVEAMAFQDHTYAAMINALTALASGIVIDLSSVPSTGVMFPRRSTPIQRLLPEGYLERDVFPNFYHKMLPLHRYHNMAGLRTCLTEFLDFLSTLTP